MDEIPEKFGRRIGLLLNAGMWSSLVLIISSALYTLLGDYYAYAFDDEYLKILTQFGSRPDLGAYRYEATTWIMIGLLLLIVIPVLRVIVSLLLFVKSRDLAYTLLTASVLVLLVFSFIMGASVR
jgi:uncharacterized membrane protein